jgi:GNAT superfamily N-acetyltransferase
VGWLWLNVPVIDGDPLMAWVNDVEVDPDYRGRGYGRAAMLLAEREARARGMRSPQGITPPRPEASQQWVAGGRSGPGHW